jgi:rRNA maturation endonuclease Nob1
MGVLDRAKSISGLGTGEDGDPPPYICLACETEFEVQHHSCPACGSFDIRRSKWVTE